MSRTHRTLALAACALLLAAGCRSHKEASRPDRPRQEQADGRERPTRQRPRTYTLIQFSGTADGTSFSGQMRVAEDSLIWVSLSKFVELGRAQATPDSVAAYSRLLGRRFDGTYADVQSRFKVKATFGELQRTALGDGLEAYVETLGRKLGHEVHISVSKREQVPSLTFPFSPPQKR